MRYDRLLKNRLMRKKALKGNIDLSPLEPSLVDDALACEHVTVIDSMEKIVLHGSAEERHDVDEDFEQEVERMKNEQGWRLSSEYDVFPADSYDQGNGFLPIAMPRSSEQSCGSFQLGHEEEDSSTYDENPDSQLVADDRSTVSEITNESLKELRRTRERNKLILSSSPEVILAEEEYETRSGSTKRQLIDLPDKYSVRKDTVQLLQPKNEHVPVVSFAEEKETTPRRFVTFDKRTSRSGIRRLQRAAADKISRVTKETKSIEDESIVDLSNFQDEGVEGATIQGSVHETEQVMAPIPIRAEKKGSPLDTKTPKPRWKNIVANKKIDSRRTVVPRQAPPTIPPICMNIPAASSAVVGGVVDYLSSFKESIQAPVDKSLVVQFYNDLNATNLKEFASDVNSGIRDLPSLVALSDTQMEGMLGVLEKDMVETTKKGSRHTQDVMVEFAEHLDSANCTTGPSVVTRSGRDNTKMSDELQQLASRVKTTYQNNVANCARRSTVQGAGSTEQRGPQKTFIVPVEMQTKMFQQQRYEDLQPTTKDSSSIVEG